MSTTLAQGKRVVISGSGNVAVYTVEKLLELGAIPLTMSDSKGYVYEPDGFTTESLHALSDHKVTKRIPLTEYETKTGARPFHDAPPVPQAPVLGSRTLAGSKG